MFIKLLKTSCPARRWPSQRSVFFYRFIYKKCIHQIYISTNYNSNIICNQIMVTTKKYSFFVSRKKMHVDLYFSSCPAHDVARAKGLFIFYKYICKKMYILYIYSIYADSIIIPSNITCNLWQPYE